MVFDGLGFGGIERVGANYAKILLDLGHEVTIVNLQPKATAMEEQFPSGCTFIHASMPLAMLPDYFLPIVKKWWWGKYLYSPVYLVSRFLLALFRSLHLKRSHFDVAIAFSGHIRDLTYVTHGFVKSEKQLGWVHGAIADYLLSSYSFGDLYIKIRNLCVLSEHYQEQALRYNSELEGKLNIALLPNPIEQQPKLTADSMAYDIKQRHGAFMLMVGRFDRDKDQSTVLRARRILEDKFGYSPHLVFVGDGPTLSLCENEAARLGLAESTTFCGAQYDVDNFYDAALIAVHSSPSEGLPTVLLEAMRCGTPIVATNSLPGVPEALGEDACGLVCAVGDPDSMAEQMAMMLGSEEIRKSYSEKGKMRIRHFAPARISEELQEILLNLE